MNIVEETGISCALQQPIQCSAFIATGSAADDNDDSIVVVRSGKMEEVVPIAGQENATCIMSETENNLVGRIHRKRVAQQDYFVAKLLEQVDQVVRDVMIEQELHNEGADICLATSKSISPRWSS